MDSMPSSNEEESRECDLEQDNDVEVVWVKSARGIWGLGYVFDGKLYFTPDICEEKWIPKDLAPPKKLVPAPAQEQNQPPNRPVRLYNRVLNWPPKQPHAQLPPPQLVPHTLCPLCKVNVCNGPKCAILVPKPSLLFL